MITLRLCGIFWVTFKWRKDINIFHYKLPQEIFIRSCEFFRKKSDNVSMKILDIFTFVDFNWFRMNKDMPLYHIPCIIAVYFILYHTLNYTFLKHLRNFCSNSPPPVFFSCSVHICFSKLWRQGIIIHFFRVLLSNNAKLFSYTKIKTSYVWNMPLCIYSNIMDGAWWDITCTKG